ncbi:unnamed protein product, partial [Toxocara canis]|uniref:ELYS protein n=1 Tax=Toxocara canis TaxID=6265 RepID=A0A183UH47_TOXCA
VSSSRLTNFSVGDEAASFSVVAEEEPETSSKAFGWFSIFGRTSRRPSRDERPRSALPYVLSVSRRTSDASSRKSSTDIMNLVRRASGVDSIVESENSFKLPDNALIGLSTEERDHIAKVIAASRRPLSKRFVYCRDSIAYRLPDLEDLQSFERQHIQEVIEKAEKRAAPFVIKMTNAIGTIKEASLDSADGSATDASQKQNANERAERGQPAEASITRNVPKAPLRKIDPISESPGFATEDSVHLEQPHLSSLKEDLPKESAERSSEDIEILHEGKKKGEVHGASDFQKAEHLERSKISKHPEFTPEELEHIQKMAEIAADMDAELSWTQQMARRIEKPEEESLAAETKEAEMPAVAAQKKGSIADGSKEVSHWRPHSSQLQPPENVGRGELEQISETPKLREPVEPELTAEELQHIRMMAEIAAKMDTELTLPMKAKKVEMVASIKGSTPSVVEKQSDIQNAELTAEELEKIRKMAEIAADMDAELTFSRALTPERSNKQQELKKLELETARQIKETTVLSSQEQQQVTAAEGPSKGYKEDVEGTLTDAELDHIRKMAELASSMEIELTKPPQMFATPHGKEDELHHATTTVGPVQQVEQHNWSLGIKVEDGDELLQRELRHRPSANQNIPQEPPELTAEEMAHIAYINSLAEAESIYSQPSTDTIGHSTTAVEDHVLSTDELEHIRAIQKMAEADGQPKFLPSWGVLGNVEEKPRQTGNAESRSSLMATSFSDNASRRLPSTEAVTNKVSSLSRLGFGKFKGAVSAVAKAAVETLPIVDAGEEEDGYYVANEADESIGDDKRTISKQSPSLPGTPDSNVARRQRLREAALTDDEINQVMAAEAKAAQESLDFQENKRFSPIDSDEIAVQEIGVDSGITEEDIEHVRKVQAMADSMESSESAAPSKLNITLDPIAFVGKRLGAAQLKFDDLKPIVLKPLVGIRQPDSTVQTGIEEGRRKSIEKTLPSDVSSQAQPAELTEEEMEHIARIQQVAEAEGALHLPQMPPSLESSSNSNTNAMAVGLASFGLGSTKNALDEVAKDESIKEVPSQSHGLDTTEEFFENRKHELAKEMQGLDRVALSPSLEGSSEATETAAEEGSEYDEEIVKQTEESARLSQPVKMSIEISRNVAPEEAIQLAAAEGQLTVEELEHIRRITEMANATDGQIKAEPELTPFGFGTVRLSDKASKFTRFGFEKLKDAVNQAVGGTAKGMPLVQEASNETAPILRAPVLVQPHELGQELTEEELQHIQEVTQMAEMDANFFSSSKISSDVPADLQRGDSGDQVEKSAASEATQLIKDSSSFPHQIPVDTLPEGSFEVEPGMKSSESIVHNAELEAEERDPGRKIDEISATEERSFNDMPKTSSDAVQSKCLTDLSLATHPKEVDQELTVEELEHIRKITELAEMEMSSSTVSTAQDLQKASDLKAEQSLTNEELAHIRSVAEMAESDDLTGAPWHAISATLPLKPAQMSEVRSRDITMGVQSTTQDFSAPSSGEPQISGQFFTMRDAEDLLLGTAEARSRNAFILNEEQFNGTELTTTIEEAFQKRTRNIDEPEQMRFITQAIDTTGRGYDLKSECKAMDLSNISRTNDQTICERVSRTMSWNGKRSSVGHEPTEDDSSLISRSESLDGVGNEASKRHPLRHMSSRSSEFSIKSVKELGRAANVSEWYEEQLSSLRDSICDDESPYETGLFLDLIIVGCFFIFGLIHWQGSKIASVVVYYLRLTELLLDVQ